MQDGKIYEHADVSDVELYGNRNKHKPDVSL